MATLTEQLQQYSKISKKDAQLIAHCIIEYDDYQRLMYEVLGMLNNNVLPSVILNDLQAERVGWNATPFLKIIETRKKLDQVLEQPPEIREGDLECPKCKQRKTIVVELQTRSADEGYTYFLHCLNTGCKAITRTN